jgi:flagellar biosynthetic protein FliR
MLAELLMREGLAFALMFSRTSGFLLTTPFPSKDVPRPARVGLALALAFFSLSLGVERPRDLALNLSLVMPMALELMLGASVGFICRVVLSAGEVAGELIGQMTGLGSASLFNPMLGTQDTVVSRIFTLLATLLFVSSGSHRIVLSYLVESFQAVPLGAPFNPADAVPVLLDTTVSAIAIGVRLAMPVVAIALIVQIALAIVARMAPSLQVFNVGFPLLIGIGLITVMYSLRDVSQVLVDHLHGVGEVLDRFFEETAR